MRRLPIVSAQDGALDAFLSAGWEPDGEVVESVRAILEAVRTRGDDALVELTRRFDDPSFGAASLRVHIPSPDAARRLVPPEIAAALETAKERVTRFHRRQRRADDAYDDPDGTQYAYVTRPLASAAAYVPGGSAPLPSTAIMTIVPAKLAGVERVAVFTPPQRSGGVHPAIAFAAALCGADELYAVGGAQAIAAAAYGTKTIAPFDAIVGPGNVWVTEAKRQVAGTCAIDGFAGPSEVLVVLDASADAQLAANELLAQAEHDAHARVAAVSQSRAALEAVSDALAARDASSMPRGGTIAHVIDARCRLILAGSFDELCAIVERFAPEHLSVRLADPEPLIARVRSAGAIFVGDATPVACGDYLAGTNHVLPTSGSARFASGLALADFTRSFAVVRNSAERIAADAPVIAALASFEGLEQHAEAARAAARNSG